jgi:hypothetical protein
VQGTSNRQPARVRGAWHQLTDCGQLDPGAVIRPVPGEWHPHMPERLDDEELADWRAGRNAIYRLAALTVGAPRGCRQISRGNVRKAHVPAL